MIFLADFSVIKPDFGLLFWTTIIFLLFWFVIGRFAFKPIAQALRKREEDIQNSLDEAKKAREEMSELKSENEALLAKAQEERSKILREAKEAKDGIIKEAKEKANEEYRAILASAKQEIENQKMAAIVELKNQIGNYSLEIAEKVLKRDLHDDKEHEDLVNKLVDELKLG